MQNWKGLIKNNSYASTILPLSYLGFQWLHCSNVYIMNIYWFGKIHMWCWMPAPLKWSAYFIFHISFFLSTYFLHSGPTYFFFVIGMVYFALVDLGIPFTLWSITSYFSIDKMKLVDIHIKQYAERFCGLTTHRPQGWLPGTMRETRTYFLWGARGWGEGVVLVHQHSISVS